MTNAGSKTLLITLAICLTSLHLQGASVSNASIQPSSINGRLAAMANSSSSWEEFLLNVYRFAKDNFEGKDWTAIRGALSDDIIESRERMILPEQRTLTFFRSPFFINGRKCMRLDIAFDLNDGKVRDVWPIVVLETEETVTEARQKLTRSKERNILDVLNAQEVKANELKFGMLETLNVAFGSIHDRWEEVKFFGFYYWLVLRSEKDKNKHAEFSFSRSSSLITPESKASGNKMTQEEIRKNGIFLRRPPTKLYFHSSSIDGD